ncbi:MAG: hypothetical protein RSC38_07770 [Oscillospiraceae bacterium]
MNVRKCQYRCTACPFAYCIEGDYSADAEKMRKECAVDEPASKVKITFTYGKYPITDARTIPPLKSLIYTVAK